MRLRLVLIVVVGTWVGTLSGLAMEPPPDADALRGPTISTKSSAAKQSIVERDFDGRVKKLDEPPALAALRVLELTPEERAATEKVVSDRAAALDAIVRDNLKLIIELALAQQAKDTQASGRLPRRGDAKGRPIFSAAGRYWRSFGPYCPRTSSRNCRGWWMSIARPRRRIA